LLAGIASSHLPAPIENDSVDQPLVSIIIRSMARSSLAEALDSIAAQTYPRIEAVVVDAYGLGHPPPGESCGRFPLRFVVHGKPLDRSAAANAGLTAAYGYYVGFLDDDDMLLPQHVSVLVEALRRQRTARVAYSGVRMIAYRPDGSVGLDVPLNRPFHLPSLRAQNYIPMHAVLFERELAEAGCRFDEELALYEDWDFWLQLAQRSEFLHVDQITACYRNFGHSGFGLQADATKIAAGRAALFDKWRTIWSGAELSEALAALRDGIIHKQPCDRTPESSALESINAQLAAQSALIEQLRARLESDWRDRGVADDYRRRADELLETVANLQDQLAEQSRQLAEVYRSSSWRITRPLRGLARAMRRLLNSAPLRSSYPGKPR